MTKFILTQWKTPENYYGFNPVGDFLLYTIHRDSDILEQSNFSVMLERLTPFAQAIKQESKPHFDELFRPLNHGWLYTFDVSCWLHGYRQYLMLRYMTKPRTTEYLALVHQANMLLHSRKVYPILDEEHYSHQQELAMNAYWNTLSIADRKELCCQPEDVNELLPPIDVVDYWRDNYEFV